MEYMLLVIWLIVILMTKGFQAGQLMYRKCYVTHIGNLLNDDAWVWLWQPRPVFILADAHI